MIFRQYDEILREEKTQTRHLNKPNFGVGDTRAMVPKRGQPAHWFYYDNAHKKVVRLESPRLFWWFQFWEQPKTTAMCNRELRRNHGAVQCRITITDIRSEPLQDISQADALAEGVGSIEEYAALWDNINTKVGTRWVDNPLARGVITFAISDELRMLYRRWGQPA